jgi:AraC family transcriptional regulator, melibiose operon regulatory protein
MVTPDSSSPAASKVLIQSSCGFRVWAGQPHVMASPHQHADVELNFVLSGAMHYFIAGKQQLVPSRRLAAFWGGVPHALVAADDATECSWTTIPLSSFLAWRLPQSLVRRLFRGDLLLEPDAKRSGFDEQQQREWADWCTTDSREHSKIVRLEVEARVRRFALATINRAPALESAPPRSEAERLSELVAEVIGTRFAERLSIQIIATAVGSSSHRVMRAFKKSCGMSIGDYLTGVRVAHAQRLLIETDSKIMDVALRSGFGSSSRFYDAFTTAVGQTPSAYREMLTKGGDER